jgi:hypothetical protein
VVKIFLVKNINMSSVEGSALASGDALRYVGQVDDQLIPGVGPPNIILNSRFRRWAASLRLIVVRPINTPR